MLNVHAGQSQAQNARYDTTPDANEAFGRSKVSSNGI
jgi:hypothetical protein